MLSIFQFLYNLSKSEIEAILVNVYSSSKRLKYLTVSYWHKSLNRKHSSSKKSYHLQGDFQFRVLLHRYFCNSLRTFLKSTETQEKTLEIQLCHFFPFIVFTLRSTKFCLEISRGVCKFKWCKKVSRQKPPSNPDRPYPSSKNLPIMS